MNKSTETFDLVCEHVRETAMLGSISGLLNWDERTKMPPAAGPYRAEQITYLAGELHKRRTAQQLGDWLNELGESDLASDPHSDQGATIRCLKRDYERATKLPKALVEELTRASVLGQQGWVEARKNNDFQAFLPFLENTVKLKREEADAVGYDDCPYDALLDDYEPGEKTANVRNVLENLRRELVPLIAAIGESEITAPREILTRSYPVDQQKKFGEFVAGHVGFDFNRGRLDVTHHPFCSGIAPHDCRLTTRYDENFFQMALYGTLHEAGHGMYEQGLRTDWYGLPPGSSVSLGIHESQSRMWENSVGRSRAFWTYFFPTAAEHFPAALKNVSPDDMYFAVNHVEPSLIRVEADEATYNLHIIIRFELEQELIDGSLAPADASQAWNEKYRNYLGVESPTAADGVLQDVHWSAGYMGYFPTYSLGNLYAAQFFDQAGADLGDLNEMFARGEFEPLLRWLNTNVHQPGRCYPAAELVQKVTGKSLSHEPLMNYLKAKLEPLYEIS